VIEIKKIAVIPAYNEEAHIKNVIIGTKKYVDQIVVVDDGSRDRTYEIAKKTGVIVVHHPINMGLGYSLRTGVELALKLGADVIITIDADGQHNPRDIPKLLNALKNVDIVLGYRPADKKMPFFKRIGNAMIHITSKILFGIDVKDTQTGFRAFKSNVWEKIKWESKRYPVASEIIKNIGINKVKYREVEIETIYHEKFKGTSIVDGIKIILNMIWWRITC